jgi:hypothetical protein
MWLRGVFHNLTWRGVKYSVAGVAADGWALPLVAHESPDRAVVPTTPLPHGPAERAAGSAAAGLVWNKAPFHAVVGCADKLKVASGVTQLRGSSMATSTRAQCGA